MSDKLERSLCEQVELYALEALSEEERLAFERHLDLCPSCREELAELREIMDLLPEAVEQVELPAGMRERVLESVLGASELERLEREDAVRPEHQMGSARAATGIEPLTRGNQQVVSLGWSQRAVSRRQSGWGRFGRWVTAGLSAAVVVLGLACFQLSRELDDTKRSLALAEAAVPSTSPSATQAPVQAPGPMRLAQAVSLKPPEAAAGSGAEGSASIVRDVRGTHLLVQADQLQALQGSQAYQVWLLRDGKPLSAGTFICTGGAGGLVFTFAPGAYDTVAITLEPDAYGELPRGSIVLAAPLDTAGL